MSGGLRATFALLGRRCYLPLFLVQFGGALNDNIMRNAIVALITYGTLANRFEVADQALMVQLALGLFMLPFFLFSASAGSLADRCRDMAVIVRWLKVLEACTVLLAAAGFASDSIVLLLGALFCAGVQSAFFGPVKYALLPVVLDRSELVGGNSLLSASTYVAILLGVIWGTHLGTVDQKGSIFMVMLAVVIVGLAAAWAMPAVVRKEGQFWPQVLSLNIIRETGAVIRSGWATRGLVPMLMLVSWFWVFGAQIITNLPNLVRHSLGGDETVYLIMLMIICLGIGVGSLLVAAVFRRAASTRHVAFGMALAGLLITVPVWPTEQLLDAPEVLIGVAELVVQPGGYAVAGVLFLVSIAMGYYIVPMYVAMQIIAPVGQRAQVIALNNILNAFFIVVGFLLSGLLLSFFESPVRGLYALYVLFGLASVVVAGLGRGTLRRIDRAMAAQAASAESEKGESPPIGVS